MEQLKPPNSLSLEGNLAENWKTWIQKLELYLVASGISEKSQKVRCATFLHVAGDEAIKVYNTMEFGEDEEEDIEVLKERFRVYCEPRKNITYLRHMFFTRAQGRNESIDAYVTDLKNKAKDCEFGQLSDSLIRDRVVCGVDNAQVRARLLREPDLTLTKAVDICRANEATQSHLKALTEESDIAVNKVAKAKLQRKPKASDWTDCGKCGNKHEYGKCPAFGQTCKLCSRKNHYARVCRSKKPRDYHRKTDRIVNEIAQEQSELFIGALTSNRKRNGSKQTAKDDIKWKEVLKINGKKLVFRLDTGADCNVLPLSYFNQVAPRHALQTSGFKLVSYTRHKMEPLGKATLHCEYKDEFHKLEFQIIESNLPAILGGESCAKMGLIRRLYTVGKVTDSSSDIFINYKDVFTGLGCVPGLHNIKIDSAVPPVIHPPRKIPIALKDQIKTELDRMEQLGVVEKQTEPTDWVNSMVIVQRPGKKLRICIDPQDLNKAIKREHYPLRTVEEVVAEMPNAQIFSVLDANHGFWQIELDDESSKLCTFNTPFGRYRFKRLPFGVSSAPEVFQKCIAQRLEDLEGVVNVMDDILVWGKDKEEHDRRLKQLLDRVRSINLKLNKDKCKLGLTEIQYIGHILSRDGLRPDPSKVKAITEMPQPQDKAALLRFLGMVQYLAKFIPNLSEVSAPLRQLLEEEVAWHWEPKQAQSFERLKTLVNNTPVLHYYDVNKEVTLSVDASSEGLGAVLLQEGQPVTYGSRALTDTQKRYAQIEKELLAIVYGCEKFKQYLYGKQVNVESDHKPLEAVFKKGINKAPPRLQRMLMRLQAFNLKVSYKPGKDLYIADTLSRAFLKEQNEVLEEELEVHVVSANLPISEEKMEQFKKATANDGELQQVRNAVMSGWPENIKSVPPGIRKYWTFKEEITYTEGLLFKNAKLVVPCSMRAEMLQRIHEAHLGIVKCKERARDILFWPGMSKQIEDIVMKCSVCNTYKRSNVKEPLLSHDIPDRAWAKVGLDLFHFDQDVYLMCVDYYSKYPEIARLPQTTSKQVIIALKSMFARHGIPDIVMSDNGPQFASEEFAQFGKTWEFKHTTSSPGFPQSNGQSERAIQSVKNLLKKARVCQGDPYLALLDYRNAPLDGVKLSPAQLLLGRRLKTKLPTSANLLKPELHRGVHKQLKKRQRKQKHYYDRGAKELPGLAEGETVRFRAGNTWQPAVVQSDLNQPRSYIIRTPQGNVFRRNRRHLHKCKEEVCENESMDSESTTVEDNQPVETTPPPKPSVSQTHSPEEMGLAVKTSRYGRVIRSPKKYSL